MVLNFRPAVSRPARTERFFDLGGLAYRVLSSTPSVLQSNVPIVLVHGIGVSHRYLARLHDALAGDRAVFSIDLPGFGGLRKPSVDIDVATMAGALGEVVASLDVRPVVLVGHSMGTQWVVEMAAQRPDLVAHVVAIGPVTDRAHRTVFAQTLALAADTAGESPRVNAIVFADYVRCGPRWYLAQLRHMLSYRIEDRIPALSMPLLLIRGARDPIAGLEWCRHLRDRASVSALVQIPGRRHLAQDSAPAAVGDAIRAYTGGSVQ